MLERMASITGPRAVKPLVLLLLALLVAGAAAGVTLSLTQAQANGVYDTDGDKLIEISYLEQLDALRYDTNGDGAADEATDADGNETADAKAYSAAFPVGAGEVVCASDCTGYELAKSLDFEQADSYRSGSVDGTLIASSGGAGWTPILRVSSTNAKVSYSATFEGNGYAISNLYVNSEYTNRATGLFGVLGSGATVKNLGLLSVSVTGWYVLSGTLPGTGALAGRNNGTISNSYAAGVVAGKNYVGGLAGKNVNTGVITKSYAAGSVAGESNVGGLVGDNLGSIVRSNSSSDVLALGNFAGGLAGYNVGSISYSYATGRVEGDTSHTQGANAIGGLLGKNLGSVNASYATGNVSGREDIGGLAGSNIGAIKGSYASGDVSASYARVGGLVGINIDNQVGTSIILSSYATGSVSGPSYVGGLVGENATKVENSYSTSSVTGTANVGGLVGLSAPGAESHGAVSAGYWDAEASGIVDEGGEEEKYGYGKTTGELQAPTGATGIYEDWTKGGVWDFGTASQYPALKADMDGDGTATVSEFGSQRSGSQTPSATKTPTPTATPAATATPTATPTGGSQTNSPTPTPTPAVSSMTQATPTPTPAGSSQTYEPTPTPTPAMAAAQSEVSTPTPTPAAAIVLSATSVTLDEGVETQAYTMALSKRPTDNVNVGLSLASGSSSDIKIYQGIFTFAPGNHTVPKTVWLGSSPDADRYDETGTITHTAVGGGYDGVSATVNVTVDDDDNDGYLNASDPTAKSILLTMTTFDGDWWHQRAGWSECRKAPDNDGDGTSDSIIRVTGLEHDRPSSITAYHTSACASGDKIAHSNDFRTRAPAIAPSNITHNSVRITIYGWNPEHDGNWYYGSSGWCNGPVSQSYSDKSGLTGNTQYQYAAYSDASCSTEIASTLTFTTQMRPVSVSNLNTSGDAGTPTFGIYANSVNFKLANAFSTGPADNGYLLKSVTARIQKNTNQPITAKLYTNSSSSTPDHHVADLGTITPTASGDLTFTCAHGVGSSNCDLERNSVYHITLEVTPSNCTVSCTHGWEATTSTTETNDHAGAGWTIGYAIIAKQGGGGWYHYRNNETTRMQVNAGIK